METSSTVDVRERNVKKTERKSSQSDNGRDIAEVKEQEDLRDGVERGD
jgi:hypothetical protein